MHALPRSLPDERADVSSQTSVPVIAGQLRLLIHTIYRGPDNRMFPAIPLGPPTADTSALDADIQHLAAIGVKLNADTAAKPASKAMLLIVGQISEIDARRRASPRADGAPLDAIAREALVARLRDLCGLAATLAVNGLEGTAAWTAPVGYGSKSEPHTWRIGWKDLTSTFKRDREDREEKDPTSEFELDHLYFARRALWLCLGLDSDRDPQDEQRLRDRLADAYHEYARSLQSGTAEEETGPPIYSVLRMATLYSKDDPMMEEVRRACVAVAFALGYMLFCPPFYPGELVDASDSDSDEGCNIGGAPNVGLVFARAENGQEDYDDDDDDGDDQEVYDDKLGELVSLIAGGRIDLKWKPGRTMIVAADHSEDDLATAFYKVAWEHCGFEETLDEALEEMGDSAGGYSLYEAWHRWVRCVRVSDSDVGDAWNFVRYGVVHLPVPPDIMFAERDTRRQAVRYLLNLLRWLMRLSENVHNDRDFADALLEQDIDAFTGRYDPPKSMPRRARFEQIVGMIEKTRGKIVNERVKAAAKDIAERLEGARNDVVIAEPGAIAEKCVELSRLAYGEHDLNDGANSIDFAIWAKIVHMYDDANGSLSSDSDDDDDDDDEPGEGREHGNGSSGGGNGWGRWDEWDENDGMEKGRESDSPPAAPPPAWSKEVEKIRNEVGEFVGSVLAERGSLSPHSQYCRSVAIYEGYRSAAEANDEEDDDEEDGDEEDDDVDDDEDDDDDDDDDDKDGNNEDFHDGDSSYTSSDIETSESSYKRAFNVHCDIMATRAQRRIADVIHDTIVAPFILGMALDERKFDERDALLCAISQAEKDGISAIVEAHVEPRSGDAPPAAPTAAAAAAAAADAPDDHAQWSHVVVTVRWIGAVRDRVQKFAAGSAWPDILSTGPSRKDAADAVGAPDVTPLAPPAAAVVELARTTNLAGQCLREADIPGRGGSTPGAEADVSDAHLMASLIGVKRSKWEAATRAARTKQGAAPLCDHWQNFVGHVGHLCSTLADARFRRYAIDRILACAERDANDPFGIVAVS